MHAGLVSCYNSNVNWSVVEPNLEPECVTKLSISELGLWVVLVELDWLSKVYLVKSSELEGYEFEE
jgi:hypothetical protein